MVCEQSNGAVDQFRHRGRNVFREHRAAIGLLLACLIVAAWMVLHVVAIFYFEPVEACLAVPFIIATQCWLYVGLFIVSHDCMHGSLVPFRPWANRLIGSAILFLYGGFSFDAMIVKHHAHHRHPGTDSDPDFDDRQPQEFWSWYVKFFTEYLTWRQPALIGGAITFYALILGAPILNLFLFWAVPALLSSLQLFTFGTYLPHRPGLNAFADRHNARTNEFSWIVSLLTCFHFGYHHEHHLRPGTPWWLLPSARPLNKTESFRLENHI